MNHNTLIMLLILIFTLLFSALFIGGGSSGTRTLLQVGRYAEDMSLVISKEEYRVLDSTEKQINEEEEEDLDFEHLMGAEECVEDDMACTKRRMTTEAYLDYIYTQKLKP